MCRLLGYCAQARSPWPACWVTDGLADFTALSAMHGDGWGMAWYDGAAPAVAKSVRRAAAEPRFADLARAPLGHARACCTCAGPPPACRAGLQLPPVPVRRLGPGPQRGHPPAGPARPSCCRRSWERQLAGTTDSERYFLHLMWRLAERDGDIMAAIADTTADIAARFEPNSLNAILLGARHAVRHLLARPGPHPARPAPGARAWPGVRRTSRRTSTCPTRTDGGCGRGGQLGLADAGLDAAAPPARAGRRPGHPAGIGASRSGVAVLAPAC